MFVVHDTARVVQLFLHLSRNIAPHVGARDSREKGHVAKRIDVSLPCLLCIFLSINVLDTLPANLLDCISDPANLDLHSRGSIAQQSWTLGTIYL